MGRDMVRNRLVAIVDAGRKAVTLIRVLSEVAANLSMHSLYRRQGELEAIWNNNLLPCLC